MFAKSLFGRCFTAWASRQSGTGLAAVKPLEPALERQRAVDRRQFVEKAVGFLD